MTSLIIGHKTQSKSHPIHGGYALTANPQKEFRSGCRDSFVKSVHDLGRDVDIPPLLDLENENNNGLIIGRTRIMNNNQMMLLENDIGIDGSLTTRRC